MRPLILLALALLFPLTLSAQPGVLEFSKIAGDVYVYTSYSIYQGVPFPSNSMYVVTSRGVVLVDTPWDPAQTGPLLDSIRARHDRSVVLCVVTHHHADRTAGLDVLKERGIPTYASRLTNELAAQSGDRLAEHTFERDTTFTVGGVALQAYYPGEGHTKDNIVVWVPKRRVLFGGCLVKSVDAADLGNVADASLAAWGPTIRRVMKRFRNPRVIVPGHFGWTSRRSLQHTLDLLRDAQ